MDEAGIEAEWDDVLRDLGAPTETIITHQGKTFAVRSNAVGVTGNISHCLRIRLPSYGSPAQRRREGGRAYRGSLSLFTPGWTRLGTRM